MASPPTSASPQLQKQAQVEVGSSPGHHNAPVAQGEQVFLTAAGDPGATAIEAREETKK